MKTYMIVTLPDDDPEDGAVAQLRLENASFCPQVGDAISIDAGTASEADDLVGKVIRRSFRFGALQTEVNVVVELDDD